MEIMINGPGEIVVCFVDPKGKTLVQERLRISGSRGISARRPVTLSVKTGKGDIEVSPVLASLGDKQSVTFDGQEPAQFTLARCKEIGCSEAVLRSIANGRMNFIPAKPAYAPTRHLPQRPKHSRPSGD
jgi:hypothetical protein